MGIVWKFMEQYLNNICKFCGNAWENKERIARKTIFSGEYENLNLKNISAQQAAKKSHGTIKGINHKATFKYFCCKFSIVLHIFL